MKRSVRGRNSIWSAVAVLPLVAFVAWSLATAAEPENQKTVQPVKGPGLGDPGKLAGLLIETGGVKEGGFTLSGRDAQQQLVVSGKYASGQFRDLSRAVQYTAAPAGIVNVGQTGLVTPVAEGKATINLAGPEGTSATISATVTNIVQDVPINFGNEITPIFTKLGCNAGGCHGKSSGQNGFKLSLLGFEPSEDYEHLVKEARGRRIFPAAPDRSLLLLKATGIMPHGGGQRMTTDSLNYRLIRRWIEQGMPYGKPTDPVVAKIEVLPRERAMQRGGQQQLAVVAHYSDGSTRDVTGMVRFDPNDTEMAEISPSGLVQVRDLTGSVAVMARFQGQVDVFRAMVPLGIKVANLPRAKNFVDELVFKKLTELGLPPSDVCDDATFLRRATLDIAGRLPTIEEAKAFLADGDSAKRAKLVDRLLDSTDYADYFANKWASVLRNKRERDTQKRGTYAFHGWLRQALHENVPYDELVRSVLAASGEVGENPPVVWYRQVRDMTQQMEDTAQLFLGLRIQCAKCHHHPFEKWSQQDYYGFAAFFSQVGRKPGLEPDEERIFHRRGQAAASNPKTGQSVKPTGLGDKPLVLSPEDDPRHALVDWMAGKDNKFFAHALVNRYWKHFFDRGLVDPEDDMRVTNPASNPELLEALAQDFIKNKFDLKSLVRAICNSNVYQFSALPNQYNVGDKQSFSRYYPKRLSAEVLLDSIDRVTNSQTRFGGVPAGTRAVQLPDNAFGSYFLTVFGRPENQSACECERSDDANLAQSLHLLNSSELQGKIGAGEGRAQSSMADKARPHEDKLRDLYLLVYSRPPDPDELGIAMGYLTKSKNDGELKAAYEDVIWALVNTKEFQFNH